MMARAASKFGRMIRAYAGATRGSVLMVWAFAMVVVIGAAGAAVDYTRAVNMRGQLAHALDASAIAGARLLSSSAVSEATVRKTVVDYYQATMTNAGYADMKLPDPDVLVDPKEGTLTVTSTFPVKTVFITVLGVDSIDVGTVAQVNYSRYNVELALVLDVTGSMKSHMASLRSAAQSVVDILMPEGTKESESKVRISLVPYSQGVNLGEYASKVSNGFAGTQNCVTERVGDQQYTDATYDYDGENSEFFGGGSNGCTPTPQMEPLTAKRNKLTSAISKLDDGGYTAGQTGIAWGWYTLSPKWTNLWPKDSDPGDYDEQKLLKFAILMTDGDFNTYYEREIKTGNCQWKLLRDPWRWEKVCDKSVEWKEEREREGYSNESSKRARKICDAMNDTTITVFSIYFGSDNSSAGAKVMQDCASDKNQHYFQASNSAELIAAFQTIASKIQSIYLSK